MIDVKKILRKKRWTGKELGQLELENFAVNYRNSLEGNTSDPDLVEHQQLVDMADSLVSDDYIRDYNGYISIHEWISIKVNIASAQMQSAQLHLNKITSQITHAMLAEEVYEYIEKQPLVLSQQEYEKLTATGSIKDNLKAQNGVAVLTQDSNSSIDTLRRQMEDNVKRTIKSSSLERFFSDNDYSGSLNQVKASELQLANCYYYLLGYNEQINLIKAYYGVSDRLDVFKHDVTYLAERIKDLLKGVQRFYINLKKADYTDKGLQSRKLETLKDVFMLPLMAIMDYKIHEANINASKILLDKFAAFDAYRDYFDQLLCIRKNSKEL